MLNSSAESRFRLSVAFVALSYRPPYQSLASYLIDLRAKFPQREQGSLQGVDWRTQALVFEEKLEELESQLQKERVEARLCRAAQHLPPPFLQTTPEISASQDVRPKKKKKTQQPIEIALPPDWQNAFRQLDPVLRPPSLGGDLEILSSLTLIQQLSALSDSSYTEKMLKDDILTLTGRCLRSSGQMLRYGFGLPVGSLQASKLFEAIASILPVIISQSLHLITGATTDAGCLDIFLRIFHEEIFCPIVNVFDMVSESRANKQLSVSKKPTVERLPPSSDIRPILLGICQSGLDSMKANPPLHASLSLLVSYTTMARISKEIRQRPLIEPRNKNETHSVSKKWRIRQLASRDSFWYLSAVLSASICATQTEAPLIETTITAEIVDMLSEMIQLEQHGGQLSLIERNVMLGIAEKAWVAGWFPMCSSGDCSPVNGTPPGFLDAASNHS